MLTNQRRLVRSTVPLSYLTGGRAGLFTPRFTSVRRRLLVFGLILITISLTDVLDGGMVTLAIYTLNLAHPGRLLQGYYPATEKTVDRHSDEV